MRFKLFSGREEAAWTTLPEHVDPGSRTRSGSERYNGTIVDLERLLLLVPPIYTSTNEPPAPRKKEERWGTDLEANSELPDASVNRDTKTEVTTKIKQHGQETIWNQLPNQYLLYSGE
ncbi:hypothetical protein AMECASPLE_030891 [Ameca splendens]|uniref:Uncharacterized protein n=1 Tax=Ameca splendens TaxID=208324 RepID=A0ABV0XJ74_9TELE